MLIKIFETAPKEGTMKEFSYEDKEYFVVKNNGKIFCADNKCPHEDIKLTLGCIKGNSIKCSLHGYSFDLVTGSCSDEDVDRLNTYLVEERNDGVYLEVL